MPNERIRILAQGTLFIKEVIRQDAGGMLNCSYRNWRDAHNIFDSFSDYECIAENSIAKDSITHKLTVLGMHGTSDCCAIFWDLIFQCVIHFLLAISSTSIAPGHTNRNNNGFTHRKIEATWHGFGSHSRLHIALQARIRRLGNGWSGCRCSKVHDRKSTVRITVSSLCHRIQQVRYTLFQLLHCTCFCAIIKA